MPEKILLSGLIPGPGLYEEFIKVQCLSSAYEICQQGMDSDYPNTKVNPLLRLRRAARYHNPAAKAQSNYSKKHIFSGSGK